jgi:alpha-galactosidase
MENRVMLSGVAPTITAPEIFGVRPGTPFIFDITAAGDRPMTFGAVGLPSGLNLDPQTGLITGTLPTNATYDLTLTATNPAGSTQQKFRVVVGSKIELTPVMGWNSWNVYQGKVTQAEVTAQANAMASSGLINYGWNYINIDDGWEDGRVAPGSPIQSDPTVFPSIPALSTLIHSLDEKFGLYSVPQGTGYAHKAAGTAGQNTLPDALQMAAWGVDYFKYDGGPPTQQQIAELSQAFQSSGRDIILSASYFSGFSTANGNSTFLPQFTNSWRVNGDITDFFTTVLNAGIANEQPWLNYSGPGHWLDPDALEIGYVGNGSAPHPSGLTQNQQQSQLSIWAMDAAPLLLGSDLTQLTPATLSILTNPEVIAVDQDPLGIQSRPVNGNTFVQSRPLADGSTAVELINANTGPATMSVNFSDLGITGPQVVRDLLAQQDVGTFSGSYTVTLPAGATALFTLRAATPGAPQITGEPVNTEVNVGSPATFSVAATGNDVLSYQWTENGVNIPGANSAVLITPATTAADNGAAFRCIVTNSVGKIISYEADLTVHGLTSPLTSTSYISATSGYYNNTVNLNANVEGYSLNINGTTYTNGLGLQAPSEIDYFLNGQDSLFQASVGIDNNGAGSVYFEVWLDGVEAYTTPLVTAHEAAIPISVNVTGAHELQLIVANGGTTTAGGNADWINPRVTSSLINVGPQLPSVKNISKTIQVNTAANFSATDFSSAFLEPNAGDSLQSITITSLPANGSLLLSGASVTAQQVIPYSQLGNFSYIPVANFIGSDSFGWLGTDQVGTAITPAQVNLTVQTVVTPPPPVGNGISFPTGFASAGNTLKLNGAAAISNGAIVLTNNTANKASSVYFTTPQNVAKFTTTFNFQITGTWPLGDGFTFVMQNAALTALGPSGGGLGYGASQANGSGGISSSVAVKFDVFYTSSGDGSVGVYSGGTFPGTNGADLGGSGFNLRSYDPNQATISYDGTTLTVTLTDLTTKVTVTRNFAVNIPANIGGTSAYVGFTGADGTLLANQVIQNWTFTPGSTTPTPPAPQLPSVSNFSKTTNANGSLSFSAAVFSGAFTEPTAGDSLQSIQITSLPVNGTLLLNNVVVTGSQVIPLAQIGNLSYVPAANFSGADSFGWTGTDQVGTAIAPALVNLTVQPVVLAPGAPANLTAAAGNGQVTLAWNASAGATSYVVSYGTTSGGPYGTSTAATTATTETISGLTNGTTYYFVVTASNSAGPSGNSAEASAAPVGPVVPPPPPPTNNSIDLSSGFAAAGSSIKLNGSSYISGGNLVLTDNKTYENSSAFFTTPQNISTFTTTFNFQITGTWPIGDGFTFVIQNAGLTALGGTGSGLGYGSSNPGGTGGIPHSVALKFDFFHTSSGNGAVGVFTNGAYPSGAGTDLGGSGFNLRSYDNSQAQVSYDGKNLTVTLTDLLTKKSVTKTFAIDIPGTIGASSAYVGFTGSDGALTANQIIQNWTFAGAPAIAAARAANPQQNSKPGPAPFPVGPTSSAAASILQPGGSNPLLTNP